jgi:hypothetical protein
VAQFEYGDYYKFFVSCGIALIVVAVGFPWLFLHEPFDLLLESSKFAALTPLAREVLTHRQSIVAWILKVIPYASSFIFAAGVFMMVWGLWKWNNRQKVRDTSEDIDLEKKKHELEDMTEKEVDAKALGDVVLQNIDKSPFFGVTAPKATSSTSDLEEEVSSYLESETAFLDVLERYLPDGYTLSRHQRSAAFVIDAVILSKDPGKPHFMIEFKKLSGLASPSTVIAAILEVSKAADWVGFGGKGHYIPVVVGVSDYLNPAWVEAVNQYLAQRSDNPTAIGRSLVRFITDRKLETLTATDVQRILSNFERVLALKDELPRPQDDVRY